MLHEMMKSDELTDITLVCDDKKHFKAHKIVLSACSSVFKSIINELPQNSSVIYLRGIQHQEMESLLEFLYLGVTKLNYERMEEFLNVARILEIKEINKDIEFYDGNTANNKIDVSDNENDNEKTSGLLKLDSERNGNKINKSKLFCKTDGMFVCYQCHSQFTMKATLKTHIQSIHEGQRHPCNHCSYQATTSGNLKAHIQSKHEGVRYDCNRCNYQATQKSHLTRHIRIQHSSEN